GIRPAPSILAVSLDGRLGQPRDRGVFCRGALCHEAGRGSDAVAGAAPDLCKVEIRRESVNNAAQIFLEISIFSTLDRDSHGVSTKTISNCATLTGKFIAITPIG
ncbi:MAG: hypothetical protein AAFR44_00490, partial [Pseudomonadota bacterium]